MNSDKTFNKLPKNGEYYSWEDADVLPKPKPKRMPRLLFPPNVDPQVLNRIYKDKPPINEDSIVVPKIKDSKNLTVYEKQALRNIVKGFAPPTPKESGPEKVTIWEKHAARKAAKEREKELKEKENNVVHSEAIPPPRLSLIPAFRAFKFNQESKDKEETNKAPGPNRPAQAQSVKKKAQDSDHYNINLKYSPLDVMVGAIGGVVVGVETGFFSKNRIPTPNVPLPSDSPLTGNFQNGVKYGATVWKVAKRAAIAGIMFSLLEQQMEQVRKTADWKNSAYSGFICGSLFGLRGGPRGIIVGGLGFTGFATLAALSKNMLPPIK